MATPSVRCVTCTSTFASTADELAMLRKAALGVGGVSFELPTPSRCPTCREQHRLPFRNEWNMFHRRCDWSQKNLISIYPDDSPFQVIDPAIWWSDEYDPLHYGRAFDFSRPFFEQFRELNNEVPKAALQNVKSENSAYTNYAAENKNCYLSVGVAGNEDCYYCYRVMSSKDICDSYDLLKCERCFGCVHGVNLYRCVECANCSNSLNLLYCENCQNCQDCAGSADLQSKRFCLFNEQLNEAEYHQALDALLREGGIGAVAARRCRSERDTYNTNCEDCSGEQLLNCSRCISCFSLKESQDCRYVGTGSENRDCCDCTFADKNELVYNAIVVRECYRVVLSAFAYSSSDSAYLMNCYNSQNTFGCSGLKRHSYCILNRQYSATDYSTLLPRIVSHMRDTGEWGEFYPPSIAPFAYNQSVANEYYPITPERARELGFQWSESVEEIKSAGTEGSAAQTSGAIQCAVTNKLFRLTAQERELCFDLGVPLPTTCPEVRRERRMAAVKRAMSHYI